MNISNYLFQVNKQQEEYLRESELVNPVYVEEEVINETIYYKIKKSTNNEETSKSIQYLTVNTLIKILLAREPILSDELSQNYDLNQLSMYFIQNHISFIDTDILFSKIFSIYQFYTENKSKF